MKHKVDVIIAVMRAPLISTFQVLLGSLRSDDGNVNDNATNQWFDWLNEEK